MKRAMILVALLCLTMASGRAGILVAFDNPNQTGSPGDTLFFTGILSNGGLDTVFLNSDALNLLGSSFIINDQFFGTVPFSLDPGQSSADIELFDVLLTNPFTDLAGTYTGTYAVLGGIDSNAQDVLGSAGFTVRASTAPEPSTIARLIVPMLVFLGLHRHEKTTSRSHREHSGDL